MSPKNPNLVFLSHSGRDAEDALQLARRLADRGVALWLDLQELKPGDRWLSEIEAALSRSQAFLVYVGSDGVERWVGREVQTALERSTEDSDYRIIPVLGPGSDPRLLPSFLRQHQWIDLRSGQSERGLDELARILAYSAAGSRTTGKHKASPFRGLLPFEATDSALFFGRDPEIEQVLNHLSRNPFLAIVGGSGTGKTSLLRAGIIPAIHRGRLRTAEGLAGIWQTVLFRPSPERVGWVPENLSQLANDRVVKLSKAFESDEPQAVRRLMQDLIPRGESLIIAVDQFEQFLNPRSRPKRRFIENLLEIPVTDSGGSIIVILALRADLFSHCWEFPGLADRVGASLFALEQPSPRQIRQIIEGPLRITGTKIAPELTDKILSEISHQPGALPLLQHTLDQLWSVAGDHGIGANDYLQIGGVHGALRRHAEVVYDSLKPTQKMLCKNLLLALSQPSGSALDIARPADSEELFQNSASVRQLRTLVDRLIEERLLCAYPGKDAGSRLIAIAHEALLRGWPRLATWLDTAREHRKLEARLRAEASDWISSGRDETYLLRGTRLAVGNDWFSQSTLCPSDVREFLNESTHLATRETAEVRARELHELSQARRIHSLLNVTVGALVLALLLAAAISLLWRRADREKLSAQSTAYAVRAIRSLQTEPLQSLVLALEAADRAPTPEAEIALRAAIAVAHEKFTLRGIQPILAARPLPDNAVLALSEGGVVNLWRAGSTTLRKLLVSDLKSASSLIVSSTGEQVALIGSSGVEIWTIVDQPPTRNRRLAPRNGLSIDRDFRLASYAENGDLLLEELASGSQRIFPVAAVRGSLLSPSGDKVLVLFEDPDRDPEVWEATDAALIRVLRRDICEASPFGVFENEGPSIASHEIKYAFSPDETRVVATSGGLIQIWSTSNSVEDALCIRGPSADVQDFAFSPDGRNIAVASDATVRVWDTGSGRLVRSLRGHDGIVSTVEYSRAGSMLLSFSTIMSEPIAKVWESATGREIGTLRGSPVTRVVDGAPAYRGSSAFFVGDGLDIFSSYRGVGRIWRSLPPPEPIALRPQPGPFSFNNSYSWHPETHKLLRAERWGPPTLWNSSSGELEGTLAALSGRARAAVFSPSGQNIAVADEDGVKIIEAAGGRLVRELMTSDIGAHPLRLTFSKDGSKLAVVGADGGFWMVVWNCSDWHRTLVLPERISRYPYAVISQNGRWFASSYEDVVTVFDATTGKPRASFDGSGSYLVAGQGEQMMSGISTLVFSPNEQSLFIGHTFGADGGVRPHKIVSVVDGSSALEIPSSGAVVESATFTPDGRFLVTASSDNFIRVWNSASGKMVSRASAPNSADLLMFQHDTVIVPGDDGCARFVRINDGKELRAICGESAAVRRILTDASERLILLEDDRGVVFISRLEISDLISAAEAAVPSDLRPEERRDLLALFSRQ